MIETAQYPKYRVSMTNACCVQVQRQFNGRWEHFRRYPTERAAGKAVIQLSRIAPASLLDQENEE